MSVEYVRWEEIEQHLDQVERFDWAAVSAVFFAYEGKLLDPRDTNGRKKAVTIGSFCSHFNISRYLFGKWLSEAREKETA